MPPSSWDNGHRNMRSKLEKFLFFFTICAGLGAVAYLATLFGLADRRPGNIALRNAGPMGDAISEKQNLRQLQANAQNLRIISDNLEQVRSEVQALRKHVRMLDGREVTLAKRVDQIADALGPYTASISKPQSGMTGLVGGAQLAAGSKTIKPGVSVNYIPMPERGFIEENLPAAAITAGDLDLTTGSLPSLSQTQFGVMLGMSRDLPELQNKWKVLRTSHKGLSSLDPKFIQDANTSPPSYLLIAGPLKNVLDAARLCVKIRTTEQECKETTFDGGEL